MVEGRADGENALVGRGRDRRVHAHMRGPRLGTAMRKRRKPESATTERRECRWPMSAEGQSRRSDRAPMTSGLPLKADILRGRRHVSKVPCMDGARGARGI